MKKYFLFIFIFLTPLFIQANDLVVNECKSDVYFVNGILTEEADAKYNAEEILASAIQEERFSNNEI